MSLMQTRTPWLAAALCCLLLKSRQSRRKADTARCRCKPSKKSVADVIGNAGAIAARAVLFAIAIATNDLLQTVMDWVLPLSTIPA